MVTFGVMEPAAICQTVLGPEKLQTILDELSSPQLKSILKQGGIKLKAHAGFVPQSVRRKQSADKILAAIAAEDHEVSSELLQQWLLHHRRKLLIDYLDALEVKHRDGETDDSFLINNSRERVREAAEKLFADYDRQEVSAYLHYVAYQQKSTAFDDWDALQTASAAPPASASAPAACAD